MFTNFLKSFFQQGWNNQGAAPKATSTVEDDGAFKDNVRHISAFKPKLSSKKFTDRNQTSMRGARSSWTLGRYEVHNRSSVQQRLNMMYAPAVRALGSAELSQVGSESEKMNVREIQAHHVLLDSDGNSVESKSDNLRSVLAKIITHPDEEVRRLIAENENTPEPGLRVLAFDSSVNVRMALIKNINCPDDILRLLVGDDSSDVSFLAVRRVRQCWNKRSA